MADRAAVHRVPRPVRARTARLAGRPPRVGRGGGVTRTFRHGLIVGTCSPPHLGHHHLIGAAAAACDTVTVIVAPSSRESIPLELRLAWLRETQRCTPAVRFVGVIDDHPIDYGDPVAWDAHCAV